jgi:hypothetical protein
VFNRWWGGRGSGHPCNECIYLTQKNNVCSVHLLAHFSVFPLCAEFLLFLYLPITKFSQKRIRNALKLGAYMSYYARSPGYKSSQFYRFLFYTNTLSLGLEWVKTESNMGKEGLIKIPISVCVCPNLESGLSLPRLFSLPFASNVHRWDFS